MIYYARLLVLLNCDIIYFNLIPKLGGICVKKRILFLVLMGVMMLSMVGCSNPKRDAKDTNIQQQMDQGTLDRS